MSGNAQGVRAGKAYVEVGADQSKLFKALRAAEARVAAFGTAVRHIGYAVSAAGGAITAPFLLAAHHFAEAGSQLKDMSDRTGIATDELQALGYAAVQTGTDIDTVEKSLGIMSKNIQNNGSGWSEAMKELGLRTEDLIGLSADKQFEMIAGALSKVEDHSTRSALAMAVFGRGGRALIPMAERLAELRAEWKGLGAAMSSTDVHAAKNLSDRWKDLKFSTGAVSNIIGAALAPLLSELAQRMADVEKHAASWLNQNRGLVVVVFKVATTVALVGTALVAVGTAIAGFGILMGWATAVASALLSPLGLIVVGAAAVTTALVEMGPGIESVLSSVSATFEDLKDTAKKAWGGIVDAIAADDLATAGKIALAGLKVIWLQATAGLYQDWIEITTGLQAIWVEVTSAISAAWVKLWSGAKAVFGGVVDWVAKRMNDVWGIFDNSFDAGAANKIIDDQAAQDQADADKERAEALERINKAEADNLTALGDAHQKKMSAAEDELAAAKEQLDLLRTQAKERREAGEMGPPVPDELSAAGSASIASELGKISTSATFNPFAAAGLSISGPFAILEKKADETNSLLRDIRDNTEEGYQFA